MSSITSAALDEIHSTKTSASSAGPTDVDTCGTTKQHPDRHVTHHLTGDDVVDGFGSIFVQHAVSHAVSVSVIAIGRQNQKTI
jgi:hypothetical protein